MIPKSAVSITSSCQKRDSHGGLEAARDAGFRHIELWSPRERLIGFDKKYAAYVRKNADECGVAISSVVVPKEDWNPTLMSHDGRFMLEIRLRDTIRLAADVGAQRVVVDYPKRAGSTISPEHVCQPARLAKASRGLHELMFSPFEFSEILKRASEAAEKRGIALLAEPPGGSDIGAKPLTFRAWKMIAAACHGIVFDLEHFAQQLIVQPFEEVFNPAERAMATRRMSDEDLALVKSFYADYKESICETVKEVFERVIGNGTRWMAASAFDAAHSLKWWAKPGREVSLNGPEPAGVSLIPSEFAVTAMTEKWASLPIGEIHLAGSHLGMRLEKPLNTIFGPSDSRLFHCYEIWVDGKSAYIGSDPAHLPSEYIHIGMDGRVFGKETWIGHLWRIVETMKAPPPLNFEILPALAASAKIEAEALIESQFGKKI